MIVIVDYGMGNLGSIFNMLKYLKTDAMISSKLSDIENAEKLILPGVGAFDNGMNNLQNLDLISCLEKKVLNQKTPILGICLGMQLLTKKSEEGRLSGLGWIDAETVRFSLSKGTNNLKVPHMGWNSVAIRNANSLFRNMDENSKFYFVHSYHVVCHHEEDILTTTHHGIDFVSAFQSRNIFGVQFHPEKSHRFGMNLFNNFIQMI
jgi:imidazole glycerol-phosphate synthase subunit HisH